MTYSISDENMDKLRKLAVDVTLWALRTPKYSTDDECQEWRKDAERLAKYFIWEDGEYGTRSCIHCDHEATIEPEPEPDLPHAPDCPIMLHRELVEKYGYKPSSEVRILKDGE